MFATRETQTIGTRGLWVATALAASLAAVLAAPAAVWAGEPQQATAAADEANPSAGVGQPTGTTAQNFPIGGALATTAVAEVSPSALAPAQGIGSRTKLTGDWGGGRTYLADHGVDLEFTLAQFGQWVTSGGINTRGAYGGKIDYRFNFDGGKLFGVNGLIVSMHAESRFGGDILADAGVFTFPNTPLLFPSPGDYHGTDITGLTVVQELYGGRAVVIGGKLHVVDVLTGLFPQMAYGLDGFQSLNSVAAALPLLRWVNLSMWGGGIQTINVERRAAQAGFLLLGTENVTTTWDIADSFRDGVGMLGFYRFFYDLGDKPGYVLALAGGSTKKYNSLDPSDWLVIPGVGPTVSEKRRPWDVSVYVHQVFWQAAGDDSRHVDLFMGAILADDNPSFAHWNFFGSVEAFGPIASRPSDRLGGSGWYNGLSENYLDLTSDLGIHLQDLWGFEAYYNAAITPWLGLTGDLQVARNSLQASKVAVIPGARLVVTF